MLDAEILALRRAASLGDPGAVLRLEAHEARTQVCARFYFRCLTCLSVVALDLPERSPRATGREKLSCVCGGTFSVMGRVRQKELVEDRERSACDERCTNASGPLCSCSCGGPNHGTGRVRTVTIPVGGIPTIEPLEPEAARERAREFLAAVAAAEARVAEIRAARVAGDLSRSPSLWALGVALRKAQTTQVHKTRMEALSAIGWSVTLVEILAAPQPLPPPPPRYCDACGLGLATEQTTATCPRCLSAPVIMGDGILRGERLASKGGEEIQW